MNSLIPTTGMWPTDIYVDRHPTQREDGRGTVRMAEGALMDDEFVVTCPYCGEESDIYIESDVTGSFVQDCEVCCNPWRVRVSREGGDRHIDVGRADGSE